MEVLKASPTVAVLSRLLFCVHFYFANCGDSAHGQLLKILFCDHVMACTVTHGFYGTVIPSSWTLFFSCLNEIIFEVLIKCLFASGLF